MPENKINEDSNKDKLIENLRAEIASYKKSKKFGLVFEEKSEKIVDKISSHVPYLSLRADKSFIVDKDAPTHELIKGDNYAALLTLLPEYRGKVDVIYIDPPYNTGNNDFIYNDRYVDKEDGYRHSTWLSFMKRRLNLAQELLSENGVIFVSIDDNEQAHLRILMDEIFAENNHMSSFIVKTPNQTENNNIKQVHEYLLCYAKSLHSESKVRKIIKGSIVEQEGRCTTGNLGQTQPEIKFPKGIRVLNIKDGIYKSTRKTGGMEDVQLISGELKVKNGKLSEDVILKARWSNPNDIKQIIDKLENKSDTPIFNKFGKELLEIYFNGDRFQPILRKLGYESLSTVINEKSTRGSKSLEDLGMKNTFSYPKDLNLLKTIIRHVDNKSATVLDFFAGSGTTGHAVAALNAEDGGTRKCILITDSGKSGNANNSDMSGDDDDSADIADDITYERMRRVLTGEDWANPDKAIALNQNFVMRDVKFVSCKETIQTIDEDLEEIEEVTDLYKSDIISRIIEDEGLEHDNNIKENLVNLLGEDYLYYDVKKANTLYNYWLTTKEQTKGGK